MEDKGLCIPFWSSPVFCMRLNEGTCLNMALGVEQDVKQQLNQPTKLPANVHVSVVCVHTSVISDMLSMLP